ncbi:hypothetical protein CEP51_013641 [Fusarium floridanum]|uniref:Erythromycin biosynthesis protein CIII-like C-terminal domain-containing protein n=1 Tax=Fusarium floridanum TaxID=1325733 RepID=A0A428Q7W8_9HYPO|nr:hypothetical protein CEP51_013641 [Fusarium floridanum]
MLRKGLFIGAILIAIFSLWASNRPSTPPLSPLNFGRKNVVLFVTTAHNGFSNVHLATSHALLEKYPDLQVHYASFPDLKPKVDRVSAEHPNSKPVIWHELPGPGIMETYTRYFEAVSGIINVPGLKGIERFVKDVQTVVAPWTVEEHWRLYETTFDVIKEVDPAVVILDRLFKPGIEATQDLNYKHVVIQPNSIIDALAHKEPRGAMFWKIPSMGSGYPYPIPWHLIPANIYLRIRTLYAIMSRPKARSMVPHLKEKGIKNPIDSLAWDRPDVPFLSATIPEASLPMHAVPENAKYCGPMVLETAPLEEQDAEMAEWLSKAPTILVNLGSGVRFDETQAREMVQAFVPVLEKTDVQILWKMNKDAEYDDSFLQPVKEHIDNRRLRIESWIKADPPSLLATGNVKLAVHHGGANCYNEAILYGVPQVVLPLWFDTYNYAATAEYRGVGIWPTKDTAPAWKAEPLGKAFLHALSDETMKEKAEKLGEIARQYGGRYLAARDIAEMAAKGHD